MEFNLKDYLKKFEQFLPLETQIKNATIKAVSDVLHISLERQKIAVSRTNIFITAPSVVKSEIGLKKAKILEKIREQLPGIVIDNVQ